MPEGTITGAQLVKTSNYVMITGLIQQTNINIADGDFGGELDPGGQDLVRKLQLTGCTCLTRARSVATPLAV